MMYCRTRRVIVARDLVDRMVDIARPATTPRPDDADAIPARLVTNRHPCANVEGSAPPLAGRAGDRALVETVVLLEAAAIALGAADIGAENIRTARAADRELRAWRHDPGTAVRWARLFHHTLLSACPNSHMLDLIDVETLGTDPFPRLIEVGVDEISRVTDDHEAILDMIASGASRYELERSLRLHASRSTFCSLALLGP
jgi:hypothetical protein